MLAPTAARASVLVLPNADTSSRVGIGRPEWTRMTADLSAAASSPLITSTAALDDAAALQACTGLWVDLGQSAETLTSTELNNLQAFVQTGRRVVLIGENTYYATWDSSILSAVGGAYANGGFDGATSTRSYTALTTGVASLNVTEAGTAASSSLSTTLFQDRVATVWGPAQNALVMLDTEALADPAMTAAGNATFASNLATWVSGGFATASNWKSSLSGSWTTTGSWSAGQMPSVADTAVFNLGRNGAGDVGYTVTVPNSKFVSALTVQGDHVTLGLTAGPAALQVHQAVSVTPPAGQNGTLTLTRVSGSTAAVVQSATLSDGGASGSTAVLALSSGVTLDAATASVAAGASIQQNGGVLSIGGGISGAGSLVQTAGVTSAADYRIGSLTLNGGSAAVLVQPPASVNGSVSILNSLSISQSGSTFLGTLDLGDSDLIVQDGDLAAITAALASGYDGGKWDGPGIDSSAAAEDAAHRTALGILRNDDGHGDRLYGANAPLGLFDGQDPTLDAILIKYTVYGDNDLSGTVTSADVAMDVPGTGGWGTGDFNYDGVVNAEDLATQNAMLDAGATTTPEPGSLVFGSALLWMASRRHRDVDKPGR